MANRAYIYSLSNRPTSYADRPETICGLSEWPYGIPFSYRVLASGDPTLCPSLISDGLDDDLPSQKTRLYAISGSFEEGFERLKKLCSILVAVADGGSPRLMEGLSETLTFLEQHRDHYVLLETIEMDSMLATGEAPLRASVEREVNVCRLVGAAVDALPADVKDAAVLLRPATKQKAEAPLDQLYGLTLDDDHDNVRGNKTDYPLGLSFWSDVLYFELWNKAEFEANR